jgi:hypothetical protein
MQRARFDAGCTVGGQVTFDFPAGVIAALHVAPSIEAGGNVPRRVFLFSGHMIDAPGREIPRFAPYKEPLVTRATGDLLRRLHAGAADLAICGGACGGDLIFAEAALTRGTHLEIYLPFDEPTFLAQSVDFAGAPWRQRYEAVKAKAVLHLMPQERRDADPDGSAYERNNQWMLELASRFGPQKLEFIALWDGRPADGPGGTEHLIEEVRRIGGRSHIITVLQAET